VIEYLLCNCEALRKENKEKRRNVKTTEYNVSEQISGNKWSANGETIQANTGCITIRV
jgi:hypothetical protein